MRNINNAMKFKLGLNTQYLAEKQAIGWTTPALPFMVFQLIQREALEIHFSDVTIKEEWVKAGKDRNLPLPLTGTRSIGFILTLFQHIFEVLEKLGIKDVTTSCRCEKRRRIYILAAKRLGAQAIEKGENISFSL